MVRSSTRRSVRSRWAVLLPTATVVLAWAAPGLAQVRLDGTVIEDGSERPIEGVRVTLLTTDENPLRTHYTDAEGRFEFAVRDRDAVKLKAERIGYQETITAILSFEEQDFFQIRIRLRTDAVALAPLEVVASTGSRVFRVPEGFERRRATGLGRYFTRAEIEERRPSHLTDLLSLVPGVRVVPRGTRRVLTMSRSLGSRDCPAQIYVDGLHMNRRLASSLRDLAGAGAFTIDDLVSPQSVEGIEVYRGISTVPAEFLSPDAACGVVVIWTRRGRG